MTLLNSLRSEIAEADGMEFYITYIEMELWQDMLQ
jgi:hypothetical protein